MKKIKNTIIPLCLAFAAFWIFQYFIGYHCPVRLITGFSCPGCGLTRAWRSVFHGDLKQAFYWHPLFLLPIPLVLIMAFEDMIPRKIFLTLMSLIAGIFIAVYIYRMAVSHPAMDRDFHNGLFYRTISYMKRIIS